MANDLEVQFSYGESPESLLPVGTKQSLIVIADDQGNTQFNGPGIGVYATSNGTGSRNNAFFDWFYYEGHLVHLDGVNFSRAWCLYGIAATLPEYSHLIPIANEHISYSLPNIVGDSYEGGHWLGTFAIYALSGN